MLPYEVAATRRSLSSKHLTLVDFRYLGGVKSLQFLETLDCLHSDLSNGSIKYTTIEYGQEPKTDNNTNNDGRNV